MQRKLRDGASGLKISKSLQSKHRLAAAVMGGMAALSCAQGTFAQVDLFKNANGAWETASNWSLGTVPTSSNNAIIDSGNTATSTGTNVSDWLVVGARTGSFTTFGNAGGSGTLNINAGSITVNNSPLLIGDGDANGTGNNSGTININAGATLTQAGSAEVYIGYNQNANVSVTNTTGTMNINGGTCNFANANVTFIGGGDNGAYEAGTMNVGMNNTGGSIIAAGVQMGGGNSFGTLNVSSGSFTSTYYLTTGNGGTVSHGTINVSGTGTLNASQLTLCENSATECDLNQTGGTIDINGQVRIGRSGNTSILGGNRGVLNLSAGLFLDTDTNDDFGLCNSNNNAIAIVNVSGTAQVNLNIGIFALNLGGNAGGTSLFNQTGGSVTVNPQSNLGLFFNSGQGGQNIYNLSGGTLTVPEITAFGGNTGAYTGGGLNNNKVITQQLILNGGTLVANNNMTVPEVSGTHSVTFTAPTNFTTVIGTGGFNINTQGFTVTWTNNLTGVASDGGITKTGQGTLVLSGSNTFTGGINISGGALDATTPGSLPGYMTPNHIQVASGATLGLAVGGSGQFQPSDVTNITSVQAFQSGSFVGIDTSAGPVSLSTNLTDSPTGSLGLTKLGTNSLTLYGTNTYTGGTNVASGTISLQSTGALGTTGPIIFGTSSPYGANAPFLQFTSANTTDYSPRFSTAPGQNVGIDTNGNNVTFSQSINTSGGYLTKIGSGTLTLAGTSNTTNGFQINADTLDLSGNYTATGGNSLIYVGNGGSNGGNSGDTGTLILDTGSNLTVTGQFADSFVLGRDGGSGTIIQNAGSTFTFNPTPATSLIVDASSATNSVGTYTMNGGTLNLSGNKLYVGLLAGQGIMTISPGASITNIGGFVIGINGGTETGTVTQTGGTVSMNTSNPLIIANGTNDTGTYTIMGGTLSVPAINSFNGGQVLFTGSSTLNLNGGTIQATMDSVSFINGLSTATVMDNATTIDNNSHSIGIAQTLVHGGNSTPDGGLIFKGSGITRLLASNSYTGNTLVQAGTLVVGNASALGTSSAILSGGATLALSKTPAQIASLTNFQINGSGNFTPVISTNGTTVQISSPIGGEQSSVFNTNAITVNDSTGFSASFTYSHAKVGGQGTGADGVTLVLLQSTGSTGSIGGGGGSDGYAGTGGAFDPGANGGAQSVAADVDEYNNQIGLGINGSFGAQSGGGSVPFLSLTGAVKVDITYAFNAGAGTGTLSETLTSLSNGSTYTFATPNIDMAQLLGGTAGGSATAYLGITGSTGGVFDSQYVSNLSIGNTATGVPLTGVAITNPVSVADGSTASIQLATSPNYSAGTVGPITIGNGSKLAVTLGTPASGVTRGTLTTPSVTFTNTASGQLDIGTNAVDITGGQTLASVTAMVASGYAGGTWAGNGIVSSAAASDSLHLTAVGVIQNSQSGTQLYTTFDGATPGTNDILVKYTYYGDTDLNGKVDGSDYSRIDNAYINDKVNPTAYTGWYNGDFNYDGVINGSDYTLIDNAFNQQGASLAASVAAQVGGSAVPEPASLSLLAIGAVGMLGRRRRHH